MKNNTTVFEIFQAFLTKEEVETICEELKYVDKSRKFRVYDLLNFFIASCTYEYKSYRDAEISMNKAGLITVDHSTISKKASEVSFELSKKLFELLISKCNRQIRRILNLPKDILSIDSTIITVGKQRLKWAKYKSTKSGVKLHVAINTTTLIPEKVVETTANKHDGPIGELLIDVTRILAEDRAYGKHERYDLFKSLGQSFVIRIKDNVILSQTRNIKGFREEESNIVNDFTCYLGEGKSKTENRFRVVEFTDYNNKSIKVCTDIMSLSAESIADIYKERWKVECFFRFIKQNLNVKTLFGTTENAVYNQLYIALITYVLLRFTYKNISEKFKFVKITLGNFIKKLINFVLELEIIVYMDRFLCRVVNNKMLW